MLLKNYSKFTLNLVKHILLFYIILIVLCDQYVIGRRHSALFEDDDDTTIRTEFVDPTNRTILRMFNLTESEMFMAVNKNPNNNNSTEQQNKTVGLNQSKALRLNDILHRLTRVFTKTTSEEIQEQPLHDMAAYPICNSDTDEISWQRDNNVTIRFADSLFDPKRNNLNLDSATLRLYKINPNHSLEVEIPYKPREIIITEKNNEKPKRCVDPILDSQIRVTVSMIQQLRRNKRAERKKRLLNSIMMNVSKTGWVEIDIKHAIDTWLNAERSHQQHHQHQTRQNVLVGWLMIEVHDEEERLLKPGLFFKPPKCDEAAFAIPWNYYRPGSSLSPYETSEVPRYPRIDFRLIGYASFVPKNYNKKIYDKLRDDLRRQIDNLSQQSLASTSLEQSNEFYENESTTSELLAKPINGDNFLNLDEANLAADILEYNLNQHRHQSTGSQSSSSSSSTLANNHDGNKEIADREIEAVQNKDHIRARRHYHIQQQQQQLTQKNEQQQQHHHRHHHHHHKDNDQHGEEHHRHHHKHNHNHHHHPNVKQ